MKKTIVSAVILVTTGAVQSATYDLTGSFTMRDPYGTVMARDTLFNPYPDPLFMSLDLTTGIGTVEEISPYMPFFGPPTWSFHDVNLQITGPETASSNMLLNWGATTNIYVTFDFGVTMNADGSIDFITLDGPGADGIAGNPMDNGPFPGFNAAFDLTATPVPAPAAVWLFGSGLFALAGFAHRRKRML